MNSFSLLTTPWLPVRFKDGTTGKLAPVDLADENVVDISAPRADLQGAVWQFLLGLLQTSFAPKDHRRWDDIWEDGLEAEKLREALQSLEHAFQFGPDSPSFMQDFEALTGDKVPVASLLPEIPGAQTTKFNKDHFIKRGVTEYLCPHCSALFARQDFDERVFTNPYEPVDLERVMTARKKYFTTSAEKQSAKAAREKKQEAAE